MRLLLALLLLLSLSVVGCDDGPSDSSATNWIRCDSNGDCTLPFVGGDRCEEGYCVDREGNRIELPDPDASSDARVDGDRPDAADDARTDASPPRELDLPMCPGTTVTCEGMTCGAGQLCLEINLSCGPAQGQNAQCIDDPCGGAGHDCMDACAESFCTSIELPDMHCASGLDPEVLRCAGGGICASPDTLIATPQGDIAIADLRSGDLVYSREDDGVIVVPLIAVTARAVLDHSVIALALDDGTTLEISGPHPLADGRALETLRVGDEVDGRRVVSATWTPYRHSHTYDVLPASRSRSYLANGVWMGTTL